LVLSGNRFWFYILTYLENKTVLEVLLVFWFRREIVFGVLYILSVQYSRNYNFSRVGYRFGFFGWYSVGISWFLPNQYRRKTRSVHFGIIILAGTPFFLKRRVTAPFFRGPAPILRKKGFPAKPLRVPAKFFSAQNTDQNTIPTDQHQYGISIPILAKLPVSKWYPTLGLSLIPILARDF
jgi:hypothetical protein